jgi:hypothetical protein
MPGVAQRPGGVTADQPGATDDGYPHVLHSFV